MRIEEVHQKRDMGAAKGKRRGREGEEKSKKERIEDEYVV